MKAGKKKTGTYSLIICCFHKIYKRCFVLEEKVSRLASNTNVVLK